MSKCTWKFLIIIFIFVSNFITEISAAEKQFKTINGKIEFLHTDYHFARVVTFEKLQHWFPFKVTVSQGDTLHITGTTSPCGCTIGRITTAQFGNGDTGSVLVEYTTNIIEGEFDRQFYIRTNSKTDSLISLHLRGETVRSVELFPYFIPLEKVVSDKDSVFKLKIKWNRNDRFVIKKISHPVYLNIDGPTQDPESKAIWNIRVSLVNGASPDFYSDSICIYTDSNILPPVVIPVKGNIRKEIECIPPRIDIIHKPGITSSNSLLVIAAKPIKDIQAVQCDTSIIRTGITQRVDTFKYRISVQVPDTVSFEGQTEILFQVNYSTGEKQQVVVQVIVSR